jgi:NAD(P)-dependent dehydrogenase (short-subunit alcohol dehydrogenase family)
MDRTIVITGASSGVGLAAAEQFAAQGDRVVVIGRDAGRLAAAVERVRVAGKGREPDPFRADFESFQQVRELAARLLDAYPTIDVLANNAGGIIAKHRRTADGNEATIQGNHLAPFLLTNLLRERLSGARVVNTASDAHRRGRPDPAAFAGDPASYKAFGAYGGSKSANILFAAEAARRWPDIFSASFHPGFVRTRFGASVGLGPLMKILPFGIKTPAQGADTLVWLASTPVQQLTNGAYYYKRKLHAPARLASDPQLAARLWETSLAAVGLP